MLDSDITRWDLFYWPMLWVVDYFKKNGDLGGGDYMACTECPVRG